MRSTQEIKEHGQPPAKFFFKPKVELWGKGLPADWPFKIPHANADTTLAAFKHLGLKKVNPTCAVPQEVITSVSDVLGLNMYLDSRNLWVSLAMRQALGLLTVDADTDTVSMPRQVRNALLSLTQDLQSSAERSARASILSHAGLTLVQRDTVIKALQDQKAHLAKSRSTEPLQHAPDSTITNLWSAPLFADALWHEKTRKAFSAECSRTQSAAQEQRDQMAYLLQPSQSKPFPGGSRKRPAPSPKTPPP